MKINLSPDPLDFNVADVDTSRPRLHAGVYEFTVEDPKLEKTKDEKGDMLTFNLKATAPQVATSGETVTNFTLKHRLSLTPTEKYPVESVRKNLTSFFRSAGIPNGNAKDILATPAMLSGKRVQAKLRIKKETSEFPESNEVQYFVEPK